MADTDMGGRRSTGRGSVQVRLALDELNLVEFPFSLLSTRQPAGLSTLVFSDEIRGPGGERIARVWTVTGAEEFGLPTATEELVYLVLTELAREQGLKDRRVYFTRYELLKRLGWPDKGSSYWRLRLALDRLLGVTITAKRAFYDPNAKSYVDVGFHIIDDYAIFDEPKGRKRADSEPNSYVRWSKTIYASLLAGYAKTTDVGLYLSLRGAVARRLYRYLDKKRMDGKGRFRIALSKLAYEKLGMSRSYYPCHIRAELARAHEELIRVGFLRGVSYDVSRSTGEEQVVYRFAGAPAGKDRDLVRRLVEIGVAEPVAIELVRNAPDEVERQLAYLPFRRARDAAALIVKAIREGWPAPAQGVGGRRRGGEAASETGRRLAEALRRLSPQERANVEQAARRQLERENPSLARLEGTAAYRAVLAEHMWQVLSERHPDIAGRGPAKG